MITTNKYQTISNVQKHNDWHFLPILLNATVGIGVGLIVGNYLGLV